jgi:hypothetical protein
MCAPAAIRHAVGSDAGELLMGRGSALMGFHLAQGLLSSASSYSAAANAEVCGSGCPSCGDARDGSRCSCANDGRPYGWANAGTRSDGWTWSAWRADAGGKRSIGRARRRPRRGPCHLLQDSHLQQVCAKSVDELSI